MKSITKFATLFCLMAIMSFSNVLSAQESKEKLEKPKNSGVTEVDAFVNKSFDAYDESFKITDAANLIKVDQETNTIKAADGTDLAKDKALFQLGELLVRAKKQNDNIAAIQDMQKSATESVKKCAITKKPVATKNLSKGGEALSEVVGETKKQIELIDKQITDIKAMP